ncbi:D-galactarolactone cycloisomerase [Variovorax paradoxus]|uniref:mandelate racemase/muconate lactonizing enzyme family protein n=1 Tax=Variovorax paradoxus TaxID=34073 RepID=UPI0027881EE2|nr:mandelate racemase/muconate lactonizing enzyme family protein [Variovorax paradoxus]MDP9962884.1 D-galactarolactone cycloisomerase [Variovorax paradoxus]
MRIVEINGFHLAYTPPIALGNGRMFIRKREFLLVRLRCNDGTVGWGESFSSPWAAAALVRRQFAPLVLGESPHHFARLYAAMCSSLGYDRRGPAMMAISALDMALHDASARAKGVRVVDMLGGPLRDSLVAYASGPFMREAVDPYGHYIDEARALVRRGFRALKPRAGLAPERDGQMTRGLRAEFGDALGLMVDINQGYTSGAAAAAVRHMEDSDLLWAEEPVGPEDLDGYRAISRASTVPLSGGEALGSLAAFRDFLQTGAISLLQPDMAVCGGFSGIQRVAALAAAFDVPMMPHVFGTVVNLNAALQVASLLPERRGGGLLPFPYIEYDATGNPLTDLFGCPVRPDGTIGLPEQPGLGIDLEPERLEPWTVDHWTERC